LHQTNVIFITSTVEHSCLLAGELLEQTQPFIREKTGVTKATFWNDFGPHFRAYQRIA
jgi:hypothetical protein